MFVETHKPIRVRTDATRGVTLLLVMATHVLVLVGIVTTVIVSVAESNFGQTNAALTAESIDGTGQLGAQCHIFVAAIETVLLAVTPPRRIDALLVGTGEVFRETTVGAVVLVGPICTVEIAVTAPLVENARRSVLTLELILLTRVRTVVLVGQICTVEFAVAAQLLLDAITVVALEFVRGTLAHGTVLLVRAVATIVVHVALVEH